MHFCEIKMISHKTIHFQRGQETVKTTTAQNLIEKFEFAVCY